ncbi:hypothetical protein [Streptomyces sp. LN704]|uniref:hypothetical protein n=1 Tax=Streptomyces sp. LN704 TaxID=3112982 RepID=UPI00371D3420
MARTKTPPRTDTKTAEPPPDQPQEQARSSPVLAWPAEWPVPELPAETGKRRRTRGMPMGPALAGAGNGTALTATAAYSAGGAVAAAAVGVVVVAGATTAAVRRRNTVRRNMAARSSGLRRSTDAGRRSGSGSRGLGGGGGLRSGVGSSRLGAGSARPSRAGASGTSGRSRSASGRSRSGILGKHRGRHDGAGRHERKLTPRQQKKATEKAARKALKNAAKNLATKSPTAQKRHSVQAAANRTARAAWQAARPHATRAGNAIARTARRTGGALWDGIRAGLVGVATVLWQRKRRVFWPAARAMWRRIHSKRAVAQKAATDLTPVAETVRRPEGTTPASTTGGTMSGGGHHFVAPAMELARAAAQYQPQGMLQVGKDFAGLEEALRLHAEAMKTTVENADATQPLAPQIIELMRQIHGLQLKAAELASELQPAFRQLHDVDISRLENPRKGVAGERMWDVSANL